MATRWITYRLKCEASTYRPATESWEIYNGIYDLRAASRQHAINRGLAKIEATYPNHKEYSAEIIAVEGDGKATSPRTFKAGLLP